MKLKKILSILLSLIMLLSSFTVTGFSAYADELTTGSCGDNVTYSFDSNTGTLTISGTGAMKNYLSIINKSPFFGNSHIISVVIEKGITSIGNYAFCSCSNLTDISFPISVTSIGSNSFNACISLTSFKIPESISSVNGSAFNKCSGLASLTVEDGNRNFSSLNGVLYNADKTTLIRYPEGKSDGSFEVPDSVTSIGANAFYSCTSLNEISLPQELENIDTFAFYNCSSLSEITIPNYTCVIYDNTNTITDNTVMKSYCTGSSAEAYANAYSKSFVSLGHKTFEVESTKAPTCTEQGYTTYRCSNCGETENRDYTALAEHSWDSGEITTSPTCIADGEITYTCTVCHETKTEALPVGEHTYVPIVTAPTCLAQGYTTYTCSVCGDYYISDETEIGGHSWNDGEIIKAPTFTENGTIKYTCSVCEETKTEDITTVTGSCGDNAFYSFEIATGILTISGTGAMQNFTYGKTPFTNQTAIKEVVIENGITGIGLYAFSDCPELKSVTIPESVTSVGYGVFYWSYGIEHISVSESNPVFDSRDNCNAIIETDSNVLKAGCKTTVIPNGVTKITDAAFYGCKDLENINFPDSITEIGATAFYKCSSLKAIKLPNGLKTIGGHAFYGCDLVHHIVIPDTVTSIGDVAFGANSSSARDSEAIRFDSHNYSLPVASSIKYKNKLYMRFDKPYANFKNIYSAYLKFAEGADTNSLNILKSLSVNGPKTYYIVGGQRSSGSNFKWQYSGTAVDITANPWDNNQPDNANNSENQLCINTSTLKYNDINIDSSTPGFIACIDLGELNSQTLNTGYYWTNKYVFYNNTIPFFAAKLVAEANGGYLATITSAEENTVVRTTAAKDAIVGGIKDSNQVFYWLNGEPFVYNDWASGEPNHSTSYNGQYFLNVNGAISSGTWDDDCDKSTSNGTSNHGFVVEYAPNDIEMVYTETDETAVNEDEITLKATYPDGTSNNIETSSINITKQNSITYKVTVKYENEKGEKFSLSKQIQLYENGKCGENAYYSYDGSTGTLTITGEGDIYDFSNGASSHFSNFYSDVKTVKIESGIISIGNNTFNGCSALETISIPDTVEIIGDESFGSCISLRNITVPNSVNKIGQYAFYKCSLLKDIVLPMSTKIIGKSAFLSCSSLQSLTVYNYNADIFYNANTVPAQAVIKGCDGSAAQKYAEAFDRTFTVQHRFTKRIQLPESEDASCSMASVCEHCGKTDELTVDTSVNTTNLYFAANRNSKVLTDLGGIVYADACALSALVSTPGLTSEANISLDECCKADIISFNENGCINERQIDIINFLSVTTLYKDESGNEFAVVSVKINDKKYIGYIDISDIVFKNHIYDTETAQPFSATGDYSICTCPVCGKKAIFKTPEHQHSYSAVTVEPTCTESGSIIYTCIVCGDTYSETLTAVGHNWDDGRITAEPSCDKSGEKTFTCTNCGDTRTEVIPSTDHIYLESARVEATCTEDGYIAYTCSLCGDEYRDVFNATGHTYRLDVTNATCTEQGYTHYTCTVCGNTYVSDYTSPLGHSLSDYTFNNDSSEYFDGTKTAICTRCNEAFTINAAPPALYSETTAAEAGEELSIPLYIRNNTGLAGFGFEFEYDSNIINPISVTGGTLISSGLNDNLEGNASSGKFKAIWYGTENIESNGNLIYLNISIKDNAKACDTVIKISCIQDDTFNEEFESVEVLCSNIELSITNENEKTEYNGILKTNSNEVTAGGIFFVSLSETDSNISLSEAIHNITYDNAAFSFVGYADENMHSVSTKEVSNSGSIEIVKDSNGSYNSNTPDEIFETLGIKHLIFKANDYAKSGSYEFGYSISGVQNIELLTASGCTIKINASNISEVANIYTESGISAEYNDTVTLPIYISNNKGVMGYMINIEYNPEHLEAVMVQRGTLFPSNINDTIGADSQGSFSVLWNGTDDISADGVLMNLVFRVLTDEYIISPITITYSQDDTFNSDYSDVVFNCINGNIHLNEEENHQFIDEVIAPTPNSKGYTRHTCVTCGYSYTDNETDYANDMSALEAALDKVGAFESADYSQKSYSVLQTAYTSYLDYPNRSIPQTTIDNATSEILSAISKLVPYLFMTVKSENGTVNVDNHETADKYSLLFGETVTMTATADEGYVFDGWYETVTKRIRSKEESITFKITSNTDFEARFVKEQSATLTFDNGSGWIAGKVTKTVSEWAEIFSIEALLPSIPYKLGYTNGRWEYDTIEVIWSLRNGTDVTITPEYDETDYQLPSVPTPLSEEPAIDLYYQLDEDNNVGSFTMAVGIPEGCRIESIGVAFYYKKAAGFDPTDFDLNINNKMTTSKFDVAEDDGIYTVDVKKFTSYYNWAARGYITYYDEEDNLLIAYSNQINVVDRQQVE